MTKVSRNTFANCVIIRLDQYEAVHGLIEEYGGRVKQFTQDNYQPETWYIFFEMAKLQRSEFEQALKESINFDKSTTTK